MTLQVRGLVRLDCAILQPLLAAREGKRVRRHFFEALTVLLFGGSLVFFYECLRFLARRDYLAAGMLTLIGVAVIRVGAELARLAMIERE